MGANLIGYMVVGPLLLDLGCCGAAQEKAEKTLKAAAEFIQWGDSHEDVVTSVPKKILKPLHHIIKEQDELDASELEALLHNTDSCKDAVDDLLAFWNGPDGANDSVRRVVNNQLVIFAGTSSWGDEPDGEGYQMLKQSQWLGLFDIFGIE